MFEVTVQRRQLGSLDAMVEDVSLHGAAIVLPGAATRGELVLVGDRLPALTIVCDRARLYTAAICRMASV